VLMAIQHQKSVNDPTRRRQRHDSFYIRSAEEMSSLFRDCKEAIDNTQRIVEQVDLELSLGKPMLPTFKPEDGSDIESHLIDRARAGLERRFGELPYQVDRDQYRARLDEELQIIIRMKFPGYFLIVADFINWAKEHDIPVGPGRGSGAGSLVAYALRITDLDPLPYALLFERFLNPERISMPDFDVDFCQERRGEVIDYVTQKYGDTKVGQIATFAQMKAKSVIKDVARSLEVPFTEVNELTKLLPNTYKDDKGNVKPITIEKALEIEPKLRTLQDEKPVYRKVIQIAQKLEGLYRQAGMHAAGIVIADKDLWDVVPIFHGSDGELITQFSMADVEDAGLVKFDFLGLKTLDVIYHAERHVNRRIAEEYEKKDWAALWKHPHLARSRSQDDLQKAKLEDLLLVCARLALDDAKVYKLLGKGETLGVFQLESSGFQELMKRLKPDRFEDIIAAVALYRPGPLQTGMVDDFIDCKHGRKSVKYPHELLQEVLEPTYGGFVYQEQVMQAAQVMAGYSLGAADLLRRAMGKKKAEAMAKERSKFVAGCTAKKIPEQKSGEVFDLMEKFAGYGFNKSHSAAYALVTFQTAYLKTYYKTEFMAALLSTEASNTDNIVKYIAETRALGTEVLPPTVNDSDISFTVAGDKIRFGLGAVKGLGDAALEALLEARTKSGEFHSLYDFCERVPLKQLNKKTLETLVKSGAFDGFGRPRAQLMEAVDRAIEAAKSTQKAEAAGQGSLFAAPSLSKDVKPREVYQDSIVEWPELERLKLEKSALGFYVTGHPLDRYADDLRRLANASIGDLPKKPNRAEVVIGCVVTALREMPVRDGTGRRAFVSIEDRSGALEMMVPVATYEEISAILKSDLPILIKAIIFQDRDEDGNQETRVRCLGARTLAEARKERTKSIVITVDHAKVDGKRLGELRQMFDKSPNGVPVKVIVKIPAVAEVEMKLPPKLTLEATDETIDRVEQLFGIGATKFG
jgi:DNA polymerase III subunit alpha